MSRTYIYVLAVSCAQPLYMHSKNQQRVYMSCHCFISSCQNYFWATESIYIHPKSMVLLTTRASLLTMTYYDIDSVRRRQALLLLPLLLLLRLAPEIKEPSNASQISRRVCGVQSPSQRWTLNPKPYKPYAIYPIPHTLNPIPWTLNPKP